MSRAMRDSGIPWIGKIPEHWEVVYGKKVYLVNDGGVWGADADGIDDTIVLRSTEQDIDGHLVISEPAKRKLSRKEFEAAKLMDGDLIITKSSGSSSHIGKTSLISKSIAELNCCFSNFIQRLRVNGYPLFYWFLLNSVVVKKQFEYLSTTTTGINNINSKTLDNLLFPTPSLAEQKAIADFLDKKCAEIDSLVAVQEQMLDELRAYKQSLITETVTHGLNPSAPMRDSGIPWIGEIPQEWKVFRLKNICTVQNGFAFDSSKFNIDYGVPIIRIRDITSGKSETYYSGEFNNAYIVTKNDLLVGMDGDFNVRWWESIDGLLNQRCCRILIPNTTIRRYAFYSLPRALKYINDLTYGTTVKHLSSGDIENTFITMPSQLLDLKQIVDYLDAKCAEIDELIATKQQKIETLKEYKKSIIYEYVTGKKEVK